MTIDEAMKEATEIEMLKSQLQSYQQAKQDGLLYIAPCPDGTEVWYLNWNLNTGNDEYLNIEDDILCDTYIHGFTEMVIGVLGKQWFLTKEEAEKALEGMK